MLNRAKQIAMPMELFSGESGARIHYVEYPDIDIQIKYPNKMVNADAP